MVDADGKAVDGATVNLAVPAPRRKAVVPATAPAGDAPPAAKAKRTRARPLQTATSDGDGAVTFKAVADGTYVLQARLKAAGNGHERVTIADGKDTAVTVTLQPKN